MVFLNLNLSYDEPTTRSLEMSILLGSLVTEVTVVGIICGVFLTLFIVAGIRQMLKNPE